MQKTYDTLPPEEKKQFLAVADQMFAKGPVDRERLARLLCDNGYGAMRALLVHIEDLFGEQIRYLLEQKDMEGLKVMAAVAISTLDISEQLLGDGAMPRIKLFADELSKVH